MCLGLDTLVLLRLLVYLHLLLLVRKSSLAAGIPPPALPSLHLPALPSIFSALSPLPSFLPFPSLLIVTPSLLLRTCSKDGSIYLY